MPQVSPITVTLDTTPIVMNPAGGNGNGAMSYRAADQHVSGTIVPKIGDGKKNPDRADFRLSLKFDVADHLDPTKTVEREAFFRVSSTMPASRDIQVEQCIEALVAFLNSDQVSGVLSGESFW